MPLARFYQSARSHRRASRSGTRAIASVCGHPDGPYPTRIGNPIAHVLANLLIEILLIKVAQDNGAYCSGRSAHRRYS